MGSISGGIFAKKVRFFVNRSFSAQFGGSVLCSNRQRRMEDSPEDRAMELSKSKIHGSMLGALLGDCLAAPFEGDDGPVATSLYRKYFEGLQKESSTKRLPFKSYTDDTAMTMMVAESLVEKRGFDARDMARRFADEYFRQPRRGYGAAVAEVFVKLRNSDAENPFEPAAQQFNGSGSFGNGGAMRMAPVPLFFLSSSVRVEVESEAGDFVAKKREEMKRVAVEQAKITHSNSLGYNGALLQSLAIANAMALDPEEAADAEKFFEQLIEEMTPVEAESTKRLKRAKQLAAKYRKTKDVDLEVVIENLGNDVTALNSVPSAVFCYLMAQEEGFDKFKADSMPERCLQWAISLGGDTDTIASMAMAIAGAHVGVENLPESLLRHCEARDQISALAERICESVLKRNQ